MRHPGSGWRPPARRSSVSPALRWVPAAACAVGLIGVLALGIGVRPASSAELTYVSAALGSADAKASLTRVERGVRSAVDVNGISVSVGSSRVSLASADQRSGTWNVIVAGSYRSTSFGRQTVLFAPQVIEEFLTVRTRTGPKLWRWRLDSGSLTPRLGADGGVSFGTNHVLSRLAITPAKIFDAAGRDVTPARTRWSLRQRRERLVARASARRSAPAAALRDRPCRHVPLVSYREHRRSEQLDAQRCRPASLRVTCSSRRSRREEAGRSRRPRGGRRLSTPWTARTFVRRPSTASLPQRPPAPSRSRSRPRRRRSAAFRRTTASRPHRS